MPTSTSCFVVLIDHSSVMKKTPATFTCELKKTVKPVWGGEISLVNAREVVSLSMAGSAFYSAVLSGGFVVVPIHFASNVSSVANYPINSLVHYNANR